jgi:hypothetical protein
MKTIRIVIVVQILFCMNTYAQTLQKEFLRDTNIIKMIADYHIEAINNHWFYEDKGIILMSKCVTDTADVYLFNACIDDRFLENPPTKYCFLFGTVVVMYDTDQKCKPQKGVLSEDDKKILLTEIGDRIYERPKIKERWYEIRWSDTNIEHKKLEWPYMVRVGGGTDIQYFLKKNGKYTKRWSY